ncbi:type II secretion system minor pseudopilin GspK [Oceanospirillum sp.]|uniref:type II secretion system minor pseudopilin GspK n=1 Tax=Oceanospirillum sp. TaxID=2021254 RepID=UPI003A8F7517
MKSSVIRNSSAQAGHRQSGVALISVLLIFAIAAILAARMMSQGSIRAEQTGAYQLQQQLEAYARGGETYAIALLKEDWRQDQAAGEQAYDHPSEPWGQLDRFALNTGHDTPDEGSLRIRILPMDGFLNINNLLKEDGGHSDVRYLTSLRQLLNGNGVPEVLADQALDWIDRNNIPTGLTGAEDNDYLLQTPAYRTSDQNLLDTDELMLLAAGSSEDRLRMSEMLVGLPSHTRINLNAANPDALAALLGQTKDQARSLLVGTEYVPIQSVTKFLTERSIPLELAELFSIRSRFFMITTQVDWQAQRLALTTLLERDLDTGHVSVLQRRFQPVSQQRFIRQAEK